MKNAIKLCVIFILLFNGFNIGKTQKPCDDIAWAKAAAGSGGNSGRSIAIDNLGNIYTTGWFEGLITFGNFKITGKGERSIYISKSDPQGNFVWVRDAGGSGWNEGLSIVVDNQGNSYVTGNISGTVTFGNITLKSIGNRDMFVTKLDAQGDFLWAKSAGGSFLAYGNGVDIDDQGNCYVSGWFNQKATFGSTVLTSNGESDIFVTKLDIQGNYIWAISTGSSGHDVAVGISVGKNSDIYITGEYEGTVTFGKITLTGRSNREVFIAKLDTNGNYIWVKSAKGSGRNGGIRVVVDKQGYSYVTGHFTENITFDKTTLTSKGINDIFIVKLDAQGNFVWANGAGGKGDDYGEDITVDNQGNVYVTGNIENEVTFGEMSVVSKGLGDIFVTKQDVNGNFIWSLGSGGKGYDFGFGISKDAQDDIYIAGFFQGVATFGNITLTGVGQTDICIFKIKSCTSSVSDANNLSESVQLFPNPVSHSFTINTESAKIRNYTIYNISGDMICNKKMELSSTEIDISSLPSCMYFIMLDTDKGSLLKKIIKQ